MGTKREAREPTNLVFSTAPICWLRWMSSTSRFCRTFSLPAHCWMKLCCSRSSTLGRSSKSLIRHLRGGPERSRRFTPKSLQIFAQAAQTDLQMKWLKASDQSSGWWRVGGGFLSEEQMEKINGKIR